jgi:hypothetical protein
VCERERGCFTQKQDSFLTYENIKNGWLHIDCGAVKIILVPKELKTFLGYVLDLAVEAGVGTSVVGPGVWQSCFWELQ